jgi:hypothetical protein
MQPVQVLCDLGDEAWLFDRWQVACQDPDEEDDCSDSEDGPERHTLEALLSNPELLRPLVQSTSTGQRRKHNAPSYTYQEQQGCYLRDWKDRRLAAVGVWGEGPYQLSVPFMTNWDFEHRDSLPISLLKYLHEQLDVCDWDYQTGRHKAQEDRAGGVWGTCTMYLPSLPGR